MPKVSVIVPIWNVEKYLPKCLDSLVNQTLKDIEIICINDGSPDNCLNILKEYQAKDDRIVIIDQTNQGVSIARNKGLEIAKGEYIGFVDPDDWVDLDFYEALYNKGIETGADVVKGMDRLYHIGSTIHNWQHDRPINNKFEFFSQFTTAIYKTDFLNNNSIFFEKDYKIAEDLFFLLKVVYYSNNFVFIENNSYYHYNRNVTNSSDSKKLSRSKIDDIISVNTQKLEFINSNQIDKESYLVVFDQIIANLIEYNFNKCCDRDSKTEILKKSIYFLEKCKYKESFLEQYKKDYHRYLLDDNIEGLYKYLKKSHKYQTKYNLKLFDLISLFKIKEYSDKKNSIKNKFYIFSIPFLKIIRKDKKTYIKLFGFIPLLKIKRNY